MNNREAIQEERERYNRRYMALCSIPTIDFINHVGARTVFMKRTNSVEQVLSQIAPFENEGWLLHSYYANSNNSIVLTYQKDGIAYQADFFCADLEGVVSWFGFNCKVVEEVRTKKSKHIVCNMGEES